MKIDKEKLDLVLRSQIHLLAPLKDEAFSIEYLLALSSEGLQEIWLGQQTIARNLEKEIVPIQRECDLARARGELIRLLIAHRAQIQAAGGMQLRNVTPVQSQGKIRMPAPSAIGLFELWPRYHTTSNAAKLVGIDRDTLFRWLKKGSIWAPQTRRGTRFYWTDAEVARLQNDIEWMRKVTRPFLGTAKAKVLAPSKLKHGHPLKPYRGRQLERAQAEIANEIARHGEKARE